jgi:hypothetical protein
VARKKAIVTELRRTNVRTRISERFFFFDDGKRVKNISNGDVILRSVGPDGIRMMHGWDPENPDAITRFFGTRSHLHGTIQANMPGVWPEIPLLDLSGRHTLARLAKIAEFDLKPADDGRCVRLEVTATTRPYFGGFKIDLDPAHGYLIRRTLTGNDGSEEVDEFKPYGDGIWIPNRVRSFNPVDGNRITCELDECEVNGPIAEKDLVVEFPEGSLVHDREKKKHYLWGKGGPAQAFETDVEMRRVVWEQWLRAVWCRVGQVFGGYRR